MKNDIFSFSDSYNVERFREALEAIQAPIASTLGPDGRNVVLYNGYDTPHITKDGVTVAEFLQFDDPFEEAINKVIKETARKTAEKVGDGTTTSIILATELMLALTAENKLPNLRTIEEIKFDIDLIVSYIDDVKTELTAFDDAKVLDYLETIVKISSNGDAEVVETLMDVLTKIGPNGLIDVIEGQGEVTTTSIMDGVLIEAPSQVHHAVELELPFIALVSSKIDKVHEIASLLKLANSLLIMQHAPLIVVAKEFSKDIINIVDINNRNSKTAVYLVESDGYANNMLDILDDMAVIFDCKVLSTDSTSPFGLQNITMDHLGEAKAATVGPQHTVIYPIKMPDEAIKLKVELQEKLASMKEFADTTIGEMRKYEKRLTKFSKSAKVRVGGATEAAKLELKDRIEDAVQAVTSAVNHGVVVGGGYTLFQASKVARTEIAKKLCKKPAEFLKRNSGIDYGLESIFLAPDESKMIDFRTNTIIDVAERSILDPADVLIKALEQAMAITEVMLKGFGLLIKVPDGED